MLFVCLLFYCRKYRFIWRFEVFAAVGAIKSLIYSQMRLNRISGGQTESVNGCERLANNLIGSQIASATIQIGVPSNSKKTPPLRR